MANAITILRMPLLIAVILMLYQGNVTVRWVAAPAIALLILMDSLDGFVARRRQQTSVLGSVLDIAADRTVELVLWVVFADLDLIPVFVPVLVLMRGIFVDAIRSVAPAHGLTPFELMRSKLGRFLVKSPWLRTPYGVVKAAAFVLLAANAAAANAAVANTFVFSQPFQGGDWLYVSAQVMTWCSVAFCLVRGVPVLIEGSQVLAEQGRD